ncbi:MAG: hypothetical protein H7144_05990 [Burkholderiales bacterium]|nr:hypothetical protein [Phycisphaerae bacterium]
MQRRHVFFAVATALCCCAIAGAQSDPAALVKQLGDPDPNIRGSAFERLTTMRDSARDALRDGTQSSQPAVAEASRALLLRLPWSNPDDPPAAIEILDKYGMADVPERARRLQMIVRSSDPQMCAVALRVAGNEPSDDVLWQSFGVMRGNPAWATTLKPVDIQTMRPAVLHLAAWSLFPEDEAAGLALMHRLMEREMASPTAKVERLEDTVKMILDRAQTHAARAVAVPYLRHLVALSSDPSTTDNAVAYLLLVHGRHGPFPGLLDDLSLATHPSDRRPGLAVAHLARRVGADLAAQLLQTRALEADEDADEFTRLSSSLEHANYLLRLGDSQAGEAILTRITAAEQTDLTRELITQSNLRLYDHFVATKNHLGAAQRLEHALGLMGDRPQLLLTRARGEAEAWTVDEMRATIAAHYLKHAVSQKNEVEASRLALELAKGSSTDEGTFVGAAEELQQRIPAADFDAYFERVYAPARKRVLARPKEAMLNNDFAWLCARAGKHLDEALTHAQEAVKRAPGNAAYLDTLAEVLFRLGRAGEAVEIERQAIELMPDDEFLVSQIARFKAVADAQK